MLGMGDGNNCVYLRSQKYNSNRGEPEGQREVCSLLAAVAEWLSIFACSTETANDN